MVSRELGWSHGNWFCLRVPFTAKKVGFQLQDLVGCNRASARPKGLLRTGNGFVDEYLDHRNSGVCTSKTFSDGESPLLFVPYKESSKVLEWEAYGDFLLC